MGDALIVVGAVALLGLFVAGLDPRDECKQQCARTAIACHEDAKTDAARATCRKDYDECVGSCSSH